MLTLLPLLGTFFTPEVAKACGADELLRFINAAQLVEEGALALGLPLLKCPNDKDRAAQWLSIWHALKGDAEAAKKLDPVPHTPRQSDAISSDIESARGGRFERLLAAIDAQTPGYAGNPSAQLTLARALVRKQRYARGQTAYVDYLRARPEDGAVESEYLYSFIAAKDYQAAEDKLQLAKSYSLSPELARSVKNGLALVQRLTGRKDPAATPLELRDESRATALLSVTSYRLTDTFARQSVSFDYHGPVDANVAAHAVKSEILDQSRARPGTITIGRDVSFAPLALATSLGLYSAKKQALYGGASVRFGAEDRPHAGFGLSQEPLGLRMALPEDQAMLMRETLFFRAGYARIIHLETSVRRDGDYAAHERHKVEVSAPLIAAGDSKSPPSLSLVIPVMLSRHPRPNPNYPSAKKLLSNGAGLDFRQRFASGFATHATMLYERFSIEHHGYGSRRAGLATLSGTLIRSFAEAWMVTLEVSLVRGERDFDLEIDQRAQVVTLGIGLLPN